MILRRDFDPEIEPIEFGLSTGRPVTPRAGRIRYETDRNAYVEYDGTAWIDVPLTNKWNDLRIDLTSSRPSTSPPTFKNFRNNVEAWAFVKNATEQVYFETQLPHGIIRQTDGLRPHIHWSPGNSTDDGSVVWEFEYTLANAVVPPGNVFPATTTVTVTQAASGTAYTHQIAQFARISTVDISESAVFVGRLARLGGDVGDTFDADAFGLSFDMHYQAAQPGSITEYPGASE